MWTASSRPWPSNTLFAIAAPRTEPRQKHLSLAVSAHSPKRSGSENNNHEGKESTQVTGGMGRAILAASGSAKPRKQQSQGDGRPPQPLSGSDVLRALHRANAEKAKQKKNNSPRSGKGARRNREESTVDITTVEPLCIKSEWSVRLEELEQRLGKLMDEAA